MYIRIFRKGSYSWDTAPPALYCIKICLEKILFFFLVFFLCWGRRHWFDIHTHTRKKKKKPNRNHFDEHTFFPCLLLLLIRFSFIVDLCVCRTNQGKYMFKHQTKWEKALESLSHYTISNEERKKFLFLLKCVSHQRKQRIESVWREKKNDKW